MEDHCDRVLSQIFPADPHYMATGQLIRQQCQSLTVDPWCPGALMDTLLALHGDKLSNKHHYGSDKAGVPPRYTLFLLLGVIKIPGINYDP